MRVPARLAAALAVGVLGATLTPSVAAADEWVRADAAHDSNSSLPPDNRFEVDPAMEREDITAVRVHYGPHRVKMAMRFTEMQTDQAHNWSVSFIVHTKSKRHLMFSVGYVDPSIPGVVSAHNEDSLEPVPCEGATAARDDAGKRVVIHIPNACIHDAPWFRLGGASRAEDSDDSATHIDDGFRDGLIPAGAVYVLGPKRVYPDR